MEKQTRNLQIRLCTLEQNRDVIMSEKTILKGLGRDGLSGELSPEEGEAGSHRQAEHS